MNPIFEDNEINTYDEFMTVKLNKDQVIDWETFAQLRKIGFNVIALNLEKMELTFENINKRRNN